jgi:hydrogenase maturation protein HypF
VNNAQRLSIGGRVQGVGYRPYIYRLAQQFQVTGWVRNNAGTVEIHAEASAERLDAFARAIFSRPPPSARAHLLACTAVSAEMRTVFSILSSVVDGVRQVSIPPDLATCSDCVAELHDPAARRYRYPFINCTQCGPRYTIIRDLPYDRMNTTLVDFELCSACGNEYADPVDRRFHAQPLACSECGPALYWFTAEGGRAKQALALAAAVDALRSGQIVAVRGVGGYHLLCDAGSETTVLRLRERKGRPAKHLAVMVPWAGADGLAAARQVADFGRREAAALLGASRPIVVVARNPRGSLCPSIAPHLRDIGVMLPYSPLHLLLLDDFGAPLVATSGNVRGEPVLTDSDEAQAQLGFIADGFLHHNRPIARPAEDPVVRLLGHTVRPIRTGRGTAPIEIDLAVPMDIPTLAVGAYQKSTIALAYGCRAIVSPYLGDQSSPRGRALFRQTIEEFQKLYGIRARRVMHDAHPQFPSTHWALDTNLPTRAIWHHHAHASAVAGEYRRSSPLLCFTWDGQGLGPDQTLWGGEALLGSPGHWRQVASFRPFKLPGGERAARETWRTALSLCWQTGVNWSAGEGRDESLLRQAFDRGVNSPSTTSVGRLFDAAAALSGVCMESTYEGEAPTRLEALCESVADSNPITMPLLKDGRGIWRSDWEPLLSLMRDVTQTQAHRATLWHSSLAHALLAQALAVHEETQVTCVALAGGVFQNRVLTQQAVRLLETQGFEVLVAKVLPLNDACVSFGQLIEGGMLHAAPG